MEIGQYINGLRLGGHMMTKGTSILIEGPDHSLMDQRVRFKDSLSISHLFIIARSFPFDWTLPL